MHRAPCAEMPLRAARLIRLDFSSRRSRTPSCLNTHPLPQRSVDYARTGRKNRQRGVYCRAASRDDLEEVAVHINAAAASLAFLQHMLNAVHHMFVSATTKVPSRGDVDVGSFGSFTDVVGA